MALEAVVFQQQDHFEYGCNMKEILCNYDFSNLMLELSCEDYGKNFEEEEEEKVVVERKMKRKRRGRRSSKNKEEVEKQRMTHIAVERNRRRLMNEYLAMLRSIMPPSYAQRGDQASIVGGAINFVKELEQLLQTLEAQRRTKLNLNSTEANIVSPFADFFAFPQYSSDCFNSANIVATDTTTTRNIDNNNAIEALASNQSPVVNIEVNMIESHANLKLLSRRRPKQLLKMVAGLQNLRFTILHLNVTTVEQMIMYTFSLKVEDNCQFTSVDDITTAVYQMVTDG